MALSYLPAFGSKTVISKNAFWPLTQKRRVQMSSLVSSPAIPDPYCSCWTVNDTNFDSTSTSLHTFFQYVIVINPSFLQLIMCWKSYLELHAHAVSKLLTGQPYLMLVPSQNRCLFKSKQYSFNGYAFTKLKRAISFNRFCFTFKFSKISSSFFL